MNDYKEVTQKYHNFILFLKSLGVQGEYMSQLEQCNVVMFISFLKSELAKLSVQTKEENQIVEAGFTKLVAEMKIDTSKYSMEDLNKFKRYIIYFYRVSSVIL